MSNYTPYYEGGWKNEEEMTTTPICAEALNHMEEGISAAYDIDPGESVPSSVRIAIYTLLSKAAYIETGLADEVAVVQAWAAEVTGITVSPATASVSSASPTAQLSAVTTPAGGAVTWASSNTAVATVSSTGLVTAVGNGTATVTATSGNVSASCAVTVSGFVEYSITNNLTNVTNSNSATTVAGGGAYAGTISVTDDYYDIGTVTVTMGGVDVTSTAYNAETGEISIDSVTGNLVITAAGVGGLYTLDNGTHEFTYNTHTGSVVVSDDNHVRVEKTGTYTSTTNYVSLNPLSGNTTDMYSSSNATAGDLTDPIFSLSANDEVKVVWENIQLSGVTKLSTMLKGTSGNVVTTGSLAVSASSGTVETTVTVATGGDVVKISSYVEAGAASAENPKYIEYDLKIYVNGVRYI